MVFIDIWYQIFHFLLVSFLKYRDTTKKKDGYCLFELLLWKQFLVFIGFWHFIASSFSIKEGYFVVFTTVFIAISVTTGEFLFQLLDQVDLFSVVITFFGGRFLSSLVCDLTADSTRDTRRINLEWECCWPIRKSFSFLRSNGNRCIDYLCCCYPGRDKKSCPMIWLILIKRGDSGRPR